MIPSLLHLPRSVERPAGELACVLAVAECDLAVHDHVADAGRLNRPSPWRAKQPSATMRRYD